MSPLFAFAQLSGFADATQTVWSAFSGLGPQLAEIILLNIVLSGDNAVVIALACMGLPKEQRAMGVMIGAGVAVIMRIIFTIGLGTLLGTPWLKLIGGILLIWIAIKLLLEDTNDKDIPQSHNVWGAVRTIALADLVMSLDNVLAIAAVAKGNWTLIIIGLLISIPLIVFGATLVMTLLKRFPILVWLGAALLGWVAGEMIAEEPILTSYISALPFNELRSIAGNYATPGHVFAALGAAFVVCVGFLMQSRRLQPR
jgi:YjbE family integral membrane protein